MFLNATQEEIPASVSITPRVGTEAYADYWAQYAPLPGALTAVQKAILAAPALPSGGAQIVDQGSRGFPNAIPAWIYLAGGALFLMLATRRK